MINEGPGFETFEPYEFRDKFRGRKRPVFRSVRPETRAAVIVLHELFGATPELFQFANRIAEEGFTAFVPILFGTPNATFRIDRAIRDIAHVCLSQEFSILGANRSSPIVEWIRALGAHVHREVGGRGIGVVGLCLTGNFALEMMDDPHVSAPVVSEPALPWCITPCLKRALGLTPHEMATIRQRTAAGQQILAFRFDKDWISPEARDDTLRATFANVRGDGKLKPTTPKAHAVFTTHFDERPGSSTLGALADLRTFLHANL